MVGCRCSLDVWGGRRRVTVIAIALASLLASIPAAEAQTADSPLVLTVAVQEESFRPSFEHPGRIEAIQTASVRPIVPGQITAIHVTPGQMVNEGDLLLELDDTDYRIALSEAEAGLMRAKANLTKAIADFDRAERLIERATISQADLDFAEANRDIAQAEVQLAEARLEKAEKNLSDTRIVAPFSAGRESRTMRWATCSSREIRPSRRP
jgi:RND family efflux transporter MFP subunit